MSELIRQLQAQGAAIDVSLLHAAYLFGHSILNGAILMYLTWWVNAGGGAVVARGAKDAKDSKGYKDKDADVLNGAANVLFLCVGMTAVMILVNDNIARAFAVGAAVALVRFRIKVAGKFLSMALFYAVLIGMACGVSRVDLAWGVTVAFGLILYAVTLLRRSLARRATRERTDREPAELPVQRAA